MLHCHTEGQPVFFTQVLLQDILQYNSARERPVEFTTTSQPRQISVVFPLMTSVNESSLSNMSGGESYTFHLCCMYTRTDYTSDTYTHHAHTQSLWHLFLSFNGSFLSYTRSSKWVSSFLMAHQHRCRNKILHTGIWRTCWRWTICFCFFAINLILLILSWSLTSATQSNFATERQTDRRTDSSS